MSIKLRASTFIWLLLCLYVQHHQKLYGAQYFKLKLHHVSDKEVLKYNMLSELENIRVDVAITQQHKQ